MNCYFHREKEAVNACCHCGKPICAECAIDIDGRMYCKECVVELVRSKKDGQRQAHVGKAPSGRTYPPHERPAAYGEDHRYTPGIRYYSGFLTFCCAMLPGAGHMFLGLIKRGIFFLGLFFLSIYLLTVSHGSVVALFMLVATSVASFFDAFRMRRLLNSGIHVDDSFDEILGVLRKYLLVIIAIFAFDFVRSLLVYRFDYFLGFHELDSLFGIAIIVLGIYFLYHATRHGKSGRHTGRDERGNDFIDKR